MNRNLNSYFFKDIHNWYLYYKRYLIYSYKFIIHESKKNNIIIVEDQESFKDFIYTIYENSNKQKISKRLLKIIF